MILIADSGSTKCDWVLMDNKGEIIFKTRTLGLNPNVLTTQKMHKRIVESDELAHISEDIEKIYFYGAGCGTEKNKNRLKRFLEKYFRKAECNVYEDIMAACLAVTKKPGVVCILGTGSNACYFDGMEAELKVPSLGYILMDEGSGNFFGKTLLRDFYYHQMPESIRSDFKTQYNLSPQFVKEKLYKQQNPNAYLAEFAKFLFFYEEMPSYLEELIYQGLEEFTEKWILPHIHDSSEPIHFIGSLAFYAQDYLKEVLDKRGLTLGNVQEKPIEGLIEYFQERIASQIESM